VLETARQALSAPVPHAAAPEPSAASHCAALELLVPARSRTRESELALERTLRLAVPAEVSILGGGCDGLAADLVFEAAGVATTCHYAAARRLARGQRQHSQGSRGALALQRCDAGLAAGAVLAAQRVRLKLRGDGDGSWRARVVLQQAESCAVPQCDAASADDGNRCTADLCDPAVGVRHEPSPPGTSCADADVCNGSEVCDGAGHCLPGAALRCDDGSACNGVEVCDAVQGCLPGTPVAVDDANPCTLDTCDRSGGVRHDAVADGSVCGELLAVPGRFEDAGGIIVACSAGAACFSGSCVAGACDYPPRIVSEPLTHALLGGAELPPEILNLRPWSVVRYPLPAHPETSWTLDASGTRALQASNGEPTILLSDFAVRDVRITGSWRVLANDDDDFIGVVFGFRDEQHFYLFDWKRAGQEELLAEQGMSVKLVAADSALSQPDLAATAGNPPRTQLLYHNDIAWSPRVSYEFELQIHPGRFGIQVRQDGALLASIALRDETYLSGKFGFYNYSQGGVEYSAVRHDSAPADYAYDVDAIDPDGDPVRYTLEQGPVGMVIDADTGLVKWAPSSADIGPHDVAVRAQDVHGPSHTQSYTLFVDEAAAACTERPDAAPCGDGAP